MLLHTASNWTTFKQSWSMVLMFLPDMIKLLDRLGVRRVKEGIPAQEERLQGGVGGTACAVHEAPSSLLALPAGCFSVTCRNASMYGKNMRDVHMAGFSVQSDAIVRFRISDGKVAVADLLVGVGRYPDVKHAQFAICKLIENSDEKISHLESLEVDKTLFNQKVFTHLK